MTRVLLVGKGPPERGGIPTFLETLMSSPLAESHRLRLLNLAHGGTPEGGRATVGNVIRSLRDAGVLWRAAGQADVVHIHSALAPTVTAVRAGLLALVARSRGCAVVVHAHGGLVQLWLTNTTRRTVLRAALAPAHRIVAVSERGAQCLGETLGRRRVLMLDNGVDVDAYSPLDAATSSDPPRILFVGLLTPRKGLLELMQASRILRTQGVQHELWLIGGTPDEGPAAEAEVRSAVKDDDVRLLGTRTQAEMPGMYRGADVYCLPSWWEAMPLSVLEAMASGLPVVASDVGDVSRAVRPGVTGLLVPPKSPQQLADALADVLSDGDRRRAMGADGRQLVQEKFSSQAMVRELARLYDEVGKESR